MFTIHDSLVHPNLIQPIPFVYIGLFEIFTICVLLWTIKSFSSCGECIDCIYTCTHSDVSENNSWGDIRFGISFRNFLKMDHFRKSYKQCSKKISGFMADFRNLKKDSKREKIPCKKVPLTPLTVGLIFIIFPKGWKRLDIRLPFTQ